jgi:Arc/MetJ family transcription regulator
MRLRERRLQKALLMYDDPNSYHDVKSALREASREDLERILLSRAGEDFSERNKSEKLKWSIAK